MENVGQGRIPWESVRENEKSSEEQMKRKTSIRYKTTHEGNGEILGWKWKVSEWSEMELKEIFK